MSKYVLELKNYSIGPDFGIFSVASHLYWAIKNTQTGQYEQIFHGGAIGADGRLNGLGFLNNKVGVTKNFGIHELRSDINEDGKVTAVLEFDTLEEIENVKRIFQATGEEINKLDESYALFGDNSNSVAYLLGRSLGLSDAQLKGLVGQLDTGVFGALGFGDDLMNGADGDYAGMSVEEFLQKAKESGAITDEQIQAITEKVEEILVPVQRIPTAELAGAGASAAFMSYARLAGWTEESWLSS